MKVACALKGVMRREHRNRCAKRQRVQTRDATHAAPERIDPMERFVPERL
jgi:hypothetical protein